MSPIVADERRAVRFEFSGLPAYTREEASLNNWFHRFFPGGKEWQLLVVEVFSGLIEKRVGTTIHLVQTSEIEQKRETREYNFDKSEIRIGRNPENDVVLAAKAIGREHARMFQEGGRFQIEDLGSSLGTWVNRKRLDPRQPYGLNNGDQITTFPYTLTFEATSTWVPETEVELQIMPTRLMGWDEFSLTTPVGFVSYELTIHPGLGSIHLQVARSFLVRLISRALREQTAGALLASDSGVIEFLLLSILERINQRVALPFQFSLQESRGNLPFTSRGLSLSIALGMAGISGSIRLFFPCEAIARMRDQAPAPPPPPALDQVCWPLTISAGNAEFTPDELSSLEPGDMVIYAADAEMLLPPNLGGTWPGIGWKGQVVSSTPYQFKVDRYFEQRSLAMDEVARPISENGGAGQRQESPDLTQLPVRLHVVLGQVDLSLAEISSMISGTVLELDKGKSDPVHLAVNGRILGTGELVEIDGKLGVRITGWSGT